MKIFAYGCSFTSYNWPSYADVLGLQYEVYNRGASGSGNERIFYMLMDDIRHKNIKQDDIVITQWSGVDRFNYLKSNKQWIGDGNILLPHNKWIFSKIKKWYNPKYEYTKSINLILAARALINDIGCKHIEMSLNPIEPVDSKFLENDLQNTYPGDYSFEEFSWKTFSDAEYVDKHPTVLQHYDIAKRITKSLGIQLTVDYNLIENVHKNILEETVFDVEYSFKDVR
jgi:hypothetical protein